MNYTSNLSMRYQEAAVNTASGERLVVMLYEGVIQSLKNAVVSIENRNLEEKRMATDKALAIIQHLQSTLDMERGGEIAVDLDRLYTYIISRVLDGSMNLNTAPFAEAIKLLTPLLNAWEEVANKKHPAVVSMEPVTISRPQESHVRLQVHG